MSDAEENDGEAGDEHCHGRECGEIAKKVGHGVSLSVYVFILFHSCSHVNSFPQPLWTVASKRNTVWPINGELK